MPQTLFDKIWDKHIVVRKQNYPDVLYIDRHYIHEVTSPQAFDGLRNRQLSIFNKGSIVATADHNVPTIDQHLPIKDAMSRTQVAALIKNCQDFGIELYGLGHPNQGIVHVIGPELGFTQPGMTIVCGDSHTSTHGAFGCIAFGIGTSEVEQVFATQTVLQTKPKQMKIEVNGTLAKGVHAKDIILYIISKISAAGGTGYFVEYCGSAIKNLSMEERMTICNMSIEMGSRGGLVQPDDITFNYLKDKPYSPKGQQWQNALEYYKTLHTDADAHFDKVYTFDAADIAPMVTYGTNPGMGIKITHHIPNENTIQEKDKPAFKKAIDYMGFTYGQSLHQLPIDYVFIGSCTNSRIEDLRVVANFVKGKKKAANVEVFIVPGSTQVKKQAQQEGLDKIFVEAGFSLRDAGCSACLGMNEDKIPAGKYCVSTSNRNFEGRQGPNARTILSSPLTAAAAAIYGKLVDVRQYDNL